MKTFIHLAVLIVTVQCVKAQDVLLDSVKFKRNQKEYTMKILESDFGEHTVQLVRDTLKFNFKVEKLDGQEFSEALTEAIDSVKPLDEKGAKPKEVSEESIWTTSDLFGKLKDAIEKQSDAPIAGWLDVLQGKIHVPTVYVIPDSQSSSARLKILNPQLDGLIRTEDSIRKDLIFASGKLAGFDLALLLAKDSLGGYGSEAKPIQDSIIETKFVITSLNSRLLKTQGTISTLKNDIKLAESEMMLPKPVFLRTKKLHIEFNEGMIEQIVALMEWVDDSNNVVPKSTDVLLTNSYPIGFSTKHNFENDFHSQSLHSQDKKIWVPLSSLIRYTHNPRLNTRDFSPNDTVATFIARPEPYKLHKSTFADIVKGSAFTDIVGIQSDKPNGLLQFEVDKRINLFTYRHAICKGRFFNYSFFQFVKPIATLSKIDGKLRTMPSDYIPTIVNNEVKTTLVSLNTDLLQFENFSAGLDLNLWLLDAQAHKFTFFFNLGARFGHVSVADTIRRIENDSIVNTGIPNPHSVNTFRWHPEFVFEIYPDERFKLSAQYRFTPIYAMNESLSQIPRAEHNDPNLTFCNRIVHTVQLGATLKVSPKVEFYIRYRIHMQNKYYKTNFQQAQIGTAFYITKKLASK